MTDHGLRYAANCSILFAELPLLERPAAAKAAGFDAVEFWWPWPDQPVPADREVDAFVAAVRDAGVQLVGLNFFAGDLAGPDCGVLSVPARVQEFRDNVEVTVGIGRAARSRCVQRPLRQPRRGRLTPGAGRARPGVDRLRGQGRGRASAPRCWWSPSAARSPTRCGPQPTPSPSSTTCGPPAPPTSASSSTSTTWPPTATTWTPPSRHTPTARPTSRWPTRPAAASRAPGRLDLDRHLADLAARGYAGWVGLEYKPTTPTTPESLAWLPRERRGLR